MRKKQRTRTAKPSNVVNIDESLAPPAPDEPGMRITQEQIDRIEASINLAASQAESKPAELRDVLGCCHAMMVQWRNVLESVQAGRVDHPLGLYQNRAVGTIADPATGKPPVKTICVGVHVPAQAVVAFIHAWDRLILNFPKPAEAPPVDPPSPAVADTLFCPACDYAVSRMDFEQAADDCTCPGCSEYNVSEFYEYGSALHRERREAYERGDLKGSPLPYKKPEPLQCLTFKEGQLPERPAKREKE